MKLVKPKKFLGQHFLKDLKVAQDIADTEIVSELHYAIDKIAAITCPD